ncbi:DUF4438 domain-containing protein [Tissierella sp. P1]|uniref:DUF4438 domain-containing protein n=1 Tax=Tissierella TaxID=41273 RepID=UPI000B9FE27A|nr:DUF4438 domain-containing protein [Tissierella sp. P1]MDU5081809.1 DUF4438 domain-containing protein [Bacillota bacterium]OZV11205.1 DUF4438 domain-containing protein [Tissierella sp. P1]
MLKTNRDKLVIQSVQGKIHSPIMGPSPYRISGDGRPMILHATGGITYNFQIGDCCMDLVGDHVEPGVSIRNEEVAENRALMVLSCVGNEARVISGDAKGAKGFVTGMHGGIEHVMIYFPQEDLEKMAINDNILIKAHGQGLAIEGHDDIVVMNLDPNLFEKIGIKENENGELEVPVVTEIPAHLMGSGIGSATSFSGDYDITTGDEKAVKEYGIDRLKFGDLVLLKDCDNTYGRQYLEGAVTIGVVVHSNCILAGHGPGVTGLLSCKTSKIKGIKTEDANIANYLGVK